MRFFEFSAALHRPAIAAGILAGILGSMSAGEAWAQASYPNKAVRIVIPAGPGGVTDLQVRLVANKLSKSLGQPVIADNRPGAGTTLGTSLVAKAAPDGYTLLGMTGSFTTASVTYAKLPYDPVNDLVPVSQFAVMPYMLVINPGVPAQNVKEFIAYAKANPGKLNYATTSVSQRLRMEPVLMKFGLNIVSVPYPTTGAAETAILGGQVQFIFANASQVSKKGGMWALATTGNRRHPKFPDVPTFIELGLPPVPGAEYSMHAPAGTPRPAINRLHAALSMALQNADVVERMDKLAYEVVNDTPEEAIKYLDSQIRLANDVAKKIGLEPQ